MSFEGTFDSTSIIEHAQNVLMMHDDPGAVGVTVITGEKPPKRIKDYWLFDDPRRSSYICRQYQAYEAWNSRPDLSQWEGDFQSNQGGNDVG